MPVQINLQQPNALSHAKRTELETKCSNIDISWNASCGSSAYRRLITETRTLYYLIDKRIFYLQ